MLISINDKTFPLTIIRKKSSLEKGLKGKKYIEGCHLFMMGDNGMNSFWMKTRCLYYISCVNHLILTFLTSLLLLLMGQI